MLEQGRRGVILKKFIKNMNIGNEYKEFVESFQTQLIDEFGEKIHSIYMCGSIPKGTAKPYQSDADFTILCEDSSDIDVDRVASIKKKTLKEFLLVTKIDTVICTLDDVRNKPNEWGFWIKIVCINIYGFDFGETVPPIVASKQFVLDLNSDTEKAINRVSQALINSTDNKMKDRYIKGYSKKLIRALYSLVLEDVGEWQDDVNEMTQSIIRFSEINPTLVEYLYTSYLSSNVTVEEFKEKADEAYAYFKNCLRTISTSVS